MKWYIVCLICLGIGFLILGGIMIKQNTSLLEVSPKYEKGIISASGEIMEIGHFNVTVTNTNGSVFLNINGATITASNVAGIGSCYQEFANVSTACGGLNTGSYYTTAHMLTPTNLYDGDWSTSATTDGAQSYFYINYSKPSGALNSSLWEVKYRDGRSTTTTQNTSILNDCFVREPIELRMQFAGRIKADCYNGSVWNQVWIQQDYETFYEEAMIWNISEVVADTTYPIFSNYWDDNATLVNSGTGHFNVTVANTNGTVLLEINGVNVTATNLTASVYNASYSFTTNGTYSYKWHSWGNGTSHNYNVSATRSYSVNVSAGDTCSYTSGNWAVTCSNNCTISSNVNGGGGTNSFSAIGFGTMTLNANITNFKNYQISGGCNVTCLKGCINYQ
jgi:hypothetical protein